MTRSAIAYSQPLILPDGTVYGVVGVELLTSYVQEKMPYAELQNEKNGAYFLVCPPLRTRTPRNSWSASRSRPVRTAMHWKSRQA